MKKILLGLLILSFGVTVTSNYQPISHKFTKSRIQTMMDQTVIVYADYGDYVTRGAGVFVDRRGLVLTAAHVVDDFPNMIFVRANNRTTYAATVVGADNLRDLALLRIEKSSQKFKAASVYRRNDLYAGQSILIIGHPDGHFYAVSRGYISRLRFLLSYFTIVGETHASVGPGNSGGPVFNEDGQIIGIMSAMILPEWLGDIRIGVFVSVYPIRSFLRRMESKIKARAFLKPRYRLGDVKK